MYLSILQILRDHQKPFQEYEHLPYFTCEEGIKTREQLGLTGIGSKNIVMKTKKLGMVVVVTTATKELDRKRLREIFGHKEMRFASPEEVLQLTGVEPGCVYPFGHPTPLPIFVDEDIFIHEYFLFNPGRHDKTIQIRTLDFKSIMLLNGAKIEKM
jgi:Ala-tRNA(Pro) deacylase